MKRNKKVRKRVLEFGVADFRNSRKDSCLFHEGQNCQRESQQTLRKKTLPQDLPAYHLTRIQPENGVSKGSTNPPQDLPAYHAACLNPPSLRFRRGQNLFEVNQTTGEVTNQLALHTSDRFLSRQAVNNVCVIFICDVLAHIAVDFAVVKLNRFLHAQTLAQTSPPVKRKKKKKSCELRGARNAQL